MSNFWNERYSNTAYIYGETPNRYYKKELLKLSPGKILLPAEGEGRNAVFAARMGWQVFAFDYSHQGMKKAQQLADKQSVKIHYQVADFAEVSYEEQSFDAVAVIFAHFAMEEKKEFLQKMTSLLKPGGAFIMEVFSKNQLKYQQLNPSSGGPRDWEMLYDTEELKPWISGFQTLELAEKEVELNEGTHHSGQASVIRFTGIKL